MDGRKRTHCNGMDRKVTEKETARLGNEEVRDLKIAKVVYCKVRYFNRWIPWKHRIRE